MGYGQAAGGRGTHLDSEGENHDQLQKVVRKIKALPDLDYHGDLRLDHLLDEISLISVLVMELAFPNLPACGFWGLARPRYPAGTSDHKIFESERDKVWHAYRTDEPP